MRKLIAIAAAAALFALPAYAAPVYVPGQQGAVGPNVSATNSDGVTLRVIQPSVTLNDATGAAVGTSGNPLFTTPASGGATSTVKIDQTTPGTTNGVQVNAALPAGTNVIGHVIADTGSTTAVTQATAANLNAQVVGNVASAAADSGNPVKVGCIVNTTQPTFTAGQRADCQADINGNLSVQLGTNIITDADGRGNTVGLVWNGTHTSTGALQTFSHLFNGSSWDREFTCASSATVNVTAANTTQIVALSGSTVIRICSIAISMSAAGTAGVYTGTGTNCATGLTAVIQDMTLATGTPLSMTAPSGGSLVRSSAGGEICVKAVTGNVTGVITYAQF